MTQLSPHFSLEELKASTKAKILGISNEPNTQQTANLKILCTNCLEKVRDMLGRPLIITSGYRCPALNKAVGSKSTSDHLKGMAADFIVKGMTPEEVVSKIRQSNIEFSQLIQERSGKSAWTHISYNPANLKKEVLIYKDGKYTKVS